MNLLTDHEIERLIQTCADERDVAARNLFAFTGARSVSGVLACLLLSEGPDREQLLAIVRRVLRNGE
jgi:hypothetical protein